MEFLGYIISRDDICMDAQGSHHCWLGYSNIYSKCLMFYWICQLLLTFHCPLLFDSRPSYLVD
jgi:hypothetical protein